MHNKVKNIAKLRLAIKGSDPVITRNWLARITAIKGSDPALTACLSLCEVQLMNGNDVAMRIFPDLHINGGNINLKRAKELDPTIQTEEDMVAKAGELIDKAGVKVSVRAVVQSKFTELLDHEGYQVHRTGIVEKSFTKADANSGTGSGDNQGGGDDLNPGENDG